MNSDGGGIFLIMAQNIEIEWDSSRDVNIEKCEQHLCELTV